MEIIIGILGIILLVAFIFVYATFAWGFVCWKFWYWFLLPVFPTLPAVTLVQCVGLMLFLHLFNVQTPQGIKKEYRDDSAHNWASVLAPPVTLLVGWLIKIIVVH
jgi:hypothetical protein